jgi:hypothetical protein
VQSLGWQSHTLPIPTAWFKCCSFILSSHASVHFVNVVHVIGVRLCLWAVATSGPVIPPPDDIWLWGAMVSDIGRTKELREKPVPVPLYPSQIPHGLTQAWTQVSFVRGWWAMTRPCTMLIVCCITNSAALNKLCLWVKSVFMFFSFSV